MGRVISTKNSSAERNRLSKTIVLAIRKLMGQAEPDALSLDLTAYIILALRAIHDSIEASVIAWEKRGYWVKADRFRLEWEWSGTMAEAMENALVNRNWPEIAGLAVKIGAKLNAIKVTDRHRLGEPWIGSWKHLSRSK